MNSSHKNQVTERIGKAELDLHADTCSVNNIAIILEYTNKVSEVSGFANTLNDQNVTLWFRICSTLDSTRANQKSMV
jgi:hypothetical protein